MTKEILTREYLVDRLTYDPETGVFTHNHNFGSRYRIGDRADTPGHAALKGYRLVNLLNQKFLAHRVVWLYAYGEMPSLSIDHIDGDRGNNRLSNLRQVSHKTNMQNRRKPRKDNSTGFIGVKSHGERFRASICIEGKTTHIGVYDTPEQAHIAYVEVKRKHHVGCTL